MAGGPGSKNSTMTKAYGGNQKTDLESLMAKFNNSLAIQNLMSTAAVNAQSYNQVVTNKSRNAGGATGP
jgi:hypothetical protein